MKVLLPKPAIPPCLKHLTHWQTRGSISLSCYYHVDCNNVVLQLVIHKLEKTGVDLL